MQLLNLLQQVQAGEVSPEDAQEMLKSLPYEDLGFAKLDHHRKVRSGFGEVIYCAGKQTSTWFPSTRPLQRKV